MLGRTALLLAALFWCGAANAQSAPAQASNPVATPGPAQSGSQPGAGAARRGPPAGRPIGAWWRNSEIVKQLGLSDAQVQQVEQIFQDYRVRLVNLHTALSQEEARLQPLVAAEHPDEAQVSAQIDKVAAARAELEKANGRMLLAIRRVLTEEQWQKLTELGQGLGMGKGMGMGRGPGMGQGMGPGMGPMGPRGTTGRSAPQ